MLALCVATNSNNLYHFYHCVTIVIGIKENFWPAMLGFQDTSNCHLHALRKERHKRKARKGENKRKKRKYNVLKGFNYTGLGEFKANRSLAHSFIFLSKHSSTSCMPSRSLLACQFDMEPVVIYLYALLTEQAGTSRDHLPADH